MHLAGIGAATLILAYCSRIEGYSYVPLFAGLVPWLLVLDRTRTLGGAALSGFAMCVVFVAAIFAWFGVAISVYSAGAVAAGLVVLLASAPLLQPQLVVFAVVRHAAGRHYGWGLRALAGVSAWVATEWMFPKLLADSFGHGFYPSPVLRQAADLAGTGGLTFLIVLINECIAAGVEGGIAAWRERGLVASGGGELPPRAAATARASLVPFGCAAAITLAIAGYGTWRLSTLRAHAGAGQPLRLGLVQSNISAYDRLRREMGAYEAVRHVLDTHFAMSRETVDRERVDALLWSETVFPTTFGKPKNETGGELDREIGDFVARLGVPLVFGSYDRDAAGEYNSAVFLEPGAVGAPMKFDVYRKVRLFLFTEYVPAWMDGPRLRAWMPWAGTWTPGPGARVLPLRVKGRTVPVLPMICLDDVDATLARDGARGGAEMILTMSNDSWFTEHPAGAHLHLVVAAFRSIETHLPQMRVTNNGVTAVVDSTGEVVARARVGERTTLVGEIAPRAAPPTLFLAWGDWLGPTSFAVAAALLARAFARRTT